MTSNAAIQAFLDDPKEMARLQAAYDQRVVRSLEKSDCWDWAGPKAKGYGILFLNRKRMSAHRVSWALENGQVMPEGKEACHSCDNPSCSNPAHIFPGTHRENMRDAVNKGRFVFVDLGRFHHNGQKTHCMHGHLLQGDNVITNKRGQRNCRICQRASNNQYAARRRATHAALARLAAGEGA